MPSAYNPKSNKIKILRVLGVLLLRIIYYFTTPFDFLLFLLSLELRVLFLLYLRVRYEYSSYSHAELFQSEFFLFYLTRTPRLWSTRKKKIWLKHFRMTASEIFIAYTEVRVKLKENPGYGWNDTCDEVISGFLIVPTPTNIHPYPKRQVTGVHHVVPRLIFYCHRRSLTLCPATGSVPTNRLAPPSKCRLEFRRHNKQTTLIEILRRTQ